MQDINNLTRVQQNHNHKQPTLNSEHKKREGLRHQKLKEQLAYDKNTRIRVKSTFTISSK